MSIAHAFEFIKEVRRNAEFRMGAYDCSNGKAFSAYLAANGFEFRPWECEDAWTNMLLRCGDEVEAMEMHVLKAWYAMLAVGVSSAAARGKGANRGYASSSEAPSHAP